jgi:molybdenum cofactor guanylyltransferase
VITAVVLVGGRSTRMGRDKATLVPDASDGRTLTQMVLDALSPPAEYALLAGRALPGLNVPAVVDQYADAGPLGGIAAALEAVHTELAVVAACDMPSIAPALVAHLVQRANERPDVLCVLCAGERDPEPLPSVWRPAAAAPLREALAAGVRSLRDAVDRLPHLVVPLHEWRSLDPTGASFVNWNRPEDLP